ncbi:NAD(P)/FAD-dependent oxidoreductase [Actinoallomurus sp. NPDC050550]|uniref:FAD-dependent oxidoreductase n=1 Tax=Actinoallomurus sp. NPDC050550 TaxID=3154937 RepID=UPI0033C87DA2
MTKVKSALVIGGGIAGPVAAVALRKAGIEATVYEAYPSTADGVGGSLALAPNGVAALRVVGADEAVLAAGRPLHRMIMAMGAKRRFDVPMVAPLHLMWRADLHRALHDHAVAHGVPVVHGKRLIGAEEVPSGVTARFADGTTATADVLIGADGVRSTVRGLIDPDAPGPNYTGMLGFESIVDGDVPGGPDSITFAFGKRAYYIYRPRPGGGAEWGANLPWHTPLPIAEARAVPAAEWLRRLHDAYGDDDPGRQLVERTSADRLQVIGALQIMPKVPHWHRGRMVLVGDAVHAPSNSSGQGASLAIESAVELARCLRDLPDAPSAFAAYEHLRRGRVEMIAARAAKINHAKAPGPVAQAMIPLLMPILTRTVMNPEKTTGPVYRHRIDWDAHVEPAPAHGR